MTFIPLNKFIRFLCDGCSWWLKANDEADGKGFIIQGIIFLSILIITLAIFTSVLLSKTSTKGELSSLPPGPRGLPLVGNLPFLKPDLHKYFSHLANIYGPIFKLHLGNKLCVVVSSSSLAKEILKDHDATFANRNPPIAAFHITYGGNDILWNQHGSDWRMMRKIFFQDMMSNGSLDASCNLRQQVIQHMVRDVYAKIGTPIDIGEFTFVTLLDMIMNMLWGGTLKGEDKTRMGEFRRVIGELVDLFGKSNISDMFPSLARFDLQGIERRGKELFLWVDRILDSVINERLKIKAVQEKLSKDDSQSKDFLTTLLELKQPDGEAKLSMKQLKALLQDAITAGTETTSVTLEWAFVEMMQNPNIMRKAQEELGEVVGMSDKVEESHISMLPYLNAVVKETHRLHPVAPFLVPHCPSQSCTIGQFTIPKGTNVFFNVWKIHRDPEAWEDPLEFFPERFLRDNNRKLLPISFLKHCRKGKFREIRPRTSSDLKALKDRLMTKNVAEEIAEKLCESVASSLEGKKQASFTRLSLTVKFDAITAGTETTSVTLEWAFAEIMQNPNIMRKAQEELGELVGMSSKVEESYISMLPYLNAVVRETHRLHPVAPFLVPHCPSQSCTIG
ncbi:hypothetical protein NE237_008022 [Protea cynaroides]|uniref:Cytochrome P450 n=1 Tax=Protea cynaroides TaxID=273540 RepID=A0A9Q0QWR0_9MAGN|nr:hypothetical protein NE237_008022 [Protea cynaroides]